MSSINTITIIAVISFLTSACQTEDSANTIHKDTSIVTDSSSVKKIEPFSFITPKGINILTRFKPPKGFERTKANNDSFGAYLRQVPLKPHGAIVNYYNGDKKTNNGVYAAVMDLSIGNKNLHQCADAVMRLKADYHYSKQEYDEIHFNLTNGFNMEYTEWKEGKRLNVVGNNTNWYDGSSPSTDKESYWKYLEMVFSYAGTLSLSKELQSVEIDEMKIGDVFIQGGSPGHAVIVVDMAENKTTGQKVFMLAQSYMPAQETQILVNPRYTELGVWFSGDFDNTLITPEWNFRKGDLKRF